MTNSDCHFYYKEINIDGSFSYFSFCDYIFIDREKKEVDYESTKITGQLVCSKCISMSMLIGVSSSSSEKSQNVTYKIRIPKKKHGCYLYVHPAFTYKPIGTPAKRIVSVHDYIIPLCDHETLYFVDPLRDRSTCMRCKILQTELDRTSIIKQLASE